MHDAANNKQYPDFLAAMAAQGRPIHEAAMDW
jgi:hypothetical protein